MPELSEMIRDHVNAVAQHVTLEDVSGAHQRYPRRSISRPETAASPRRSGRGRRSACRGPRGLFW